MRGRGYRLVSQAGCFLPGCHPGAHRVSMETPTHFLMVSAPALHFCLLFSLLRVTVSLALTLCALSSLRFSLPPSFCDLFRFTPTHYTKQLIQRDLSPTCTHHVQTHPIQSAVALPKLAAESLIPSAHGPAHLNHPDWHSSAFPSIPAILTGWRLGLDAGLRVWTFGSQPVPAPEMSLGW